MAASSHAIRCQPIQAVLTAGFVTPPAFAKKLVLAIPTAPTLERFATSVQAQHRRFRFVKITVPLRLVLVVKNVIRTFRQQQATMSKLTRIKPVNSYALKEPCAAKTTHSNADRSVTRAATSVTVNLTHRLKASLALSLSLWISACQTLQPNLQKPSGQIGVQIQSVDSGKVVYQENQDTFFIPASTLKLFTIATALAKLGPSHRFETHVYYDNNLYLKGSGDPSFSVHDLDDLASRIKQLIHKPIQNIIIDSTVFDSNYYGQDWLTEDLPKGFSAPISGLNVNYNRLVVGFLPDKTILLDPWTRYVQLEKKHNWFKISGHGINIEGKFPQTNKPTYKTYAIQTPDLWAGFLFKEALTRAGVKIKGAILSGKTPEGLVPITSDYSPYLSEMVINYTKFSNNLGNEALLKTLGNGSFEQGLLVVRETVGIPGIADGSGLSRSNQITPAQMTGFLVRTAKNFRISPEFIAAMPIGGEDGTLKNSFQDSDFRGNIRAKTGTMSGIRGYAGFYKQPNGGLFAFTLFANELAGDAQKLKTYLELILQNIK